MATEITELILGGPAWRGKELEAGDIVLKVAQADGEPIEVGEQEVAAFIRSLEAEKFSSVEVE